MRVNPIDKKSADENAPSFDPWPRGEYDFLVHESLEQESNSGNEMIKLTLHVFNRGAQRRVVFDYLVNTEKGAWKQRHFADSIGITRQYEAGDLSPRYMTGKPGRCKLRIDQGDGSFAPKNVVEDYLAKEESHHTPPPVAPRVREPVADRQSATVRAGDIDDEVPF
jgi:hypothetical protein